MYPNPVPSRNPRMTVSICTPRLGIKTIGLLDSHRAVSEQVIMETQRAFLGDVVNEALPRGWPETTHQVKGLLTYCLTSLIVLWALAACTAKVC